jgi:hypothetical protein
MIYYDNEHKPYIKYQSDEVDKVLTSLGKAHKSFETIEKTGKAQYGSFASLTDIWSACGKSLDNNGLTVISRIARIHSKNMFVLTIFHIESGQFLSSSSDMGEYKTIHGYGSLITYFRRYLLTPMLNLEGDYDDDGNIIQSEQMPELDYNHKWQPYRYLDARGEVKQKFDGVGSISDWSKKIQSLLFYMKDGNLKNLPTLKANRNEMERVCASIRNRDETKIIPPQVKEIHKKTLDTIQQAMEIINAN